MISFDDIRGFLKICDCSCEFEKDHANNWRMTNGEYISFWSDDASVALFILKRILEKLGKQVKDFNNFMEAKYNKPFNVVFDSNPPQIRTKLEVEAMAVSFEPPEKGENGHAKV